MNFTRGKIALSVCVLLAVSAACGRPTPGGGEVFPVSATTQPAATPAQVEHTAAPAVEHATAPAPHGTGAAPLRPSTPSAAELSPVSATEQYATAPAPHGTGAAPLRPNSTPTPGEPTPAGGTVQPPPDTNSSGVCANPYFPVKLGTRWVYNFEGGAGYEEEITDVRADGFTVTLKDEDLINPREWACRPEGLVALSFGGGPAATASSSGITVRFTTTNVTGVTLPANPAPGMTWTQTFDVTMTPPGVSGTVSLTYSAVAIESVTVPAGTFQALKVEVQQTVTAAIPNTAPLQSTFTVWFAPGVGWIKQITAEGLSELAVYASPAP